MDEQEEQAETVEVPGKTTPSQVEVFLASRGIPMSFAINVLWVVGTIVLACVILLAVTWYKKSKERRAEEASRALFEASAQLFQPNSAMKVGMLMDQNKSAKSGPLLLLTLAAAQYAEGNFAAAHSSYQQFLTKYPKHELALVPELGKIVCAESQMEDPEQVMSAYAEFLAKHPDSFLTGQATFGQARCLEKMGKLEEARQVYEDFAVAQAENVWKDKVEAALKALETEIKRQNGTL